MQRLLTPLIPAALAVGMSGFSIGTANAGAFGGFYAAPQPTIERVRHRNDCHNLTHNHYVPEWGLVAPHHHKGPYCTPIQDENDIDEPRQYYQGNYGDDGVYSGFGDDRYRRRHRSNSYYGWQ
jgi:hypothetical protein